MSEVVLDASALLAYLNEEPGAEAVEEVGASGLHRGSQLGGSALQSSGNRGGSGSPSFASSRRAASWIKPLRSCPSCRKMGPAIARLRRRPRAAPLPCLGYAIPAAAARWLSARIMLSRYSAFDSQKRGARILSPSKSVRISIP